MNSTKRDCYCLIQETAIKRSPFCPWCGSPSVVGHHLFKRDRLATAFLPEAVQGMCDFHHHHWHAHPKEFAAEMKKRIGVETYDKLRQLSYTVTKNMDYKAMRKNLQVMLEGLDGEDI